MYGREKAYAEPDWRRRLGYHLLGELHVPGRLRIWHVIKELRGLGLWDPGARSFLDAGGGEGAFAYYVARRFPAWRVVVADNDRAALARAARIKERLRLGNLELREADLRHLDDEGAHDIVLCSDVLEHIEDDGLVVKNLARGLRRGGVCLVTSPSVPQPRHLPLVGWRERRIAFDPADYGHVRAGYSKASLRELLQNAGLSVEAIRFTFGPFGTLMFDLFFVTGDSRPSPPVYAALFPLYMALSALDVMLPARHGAAILGVGRKS